jgi:hypothetical protein
VPTHISTACDALSILKWAGVEIYPGFIFGSAHSNLSQLAAEQTLMAAFHPVQQPEAVLRTIKTVEFPMHALAWIQAWNCGGIITV